MGTYKSILIDVEAEGNTLSEVIKFLNFKDPTTVDFCFRKWSEETKWWADDLVKDASLKFPKIMFRLKTRGGYNSNILYVNGLGLNTEYVMENPRFPSKNKWESAVKRYRKSLEEKQKLAVINERKKQEELKVKYENELKTIQEKLSQLKI